MTSSPVERAYRLIVQLAAAWDLLRNGAVVGPVRGENLVGLAAEQEVEFLLEDAVELFAELLIEIGHRPAAELEALGQILGRRAGRLHDAIHGNLGADDNLPHGSISLLN